MVGAPRMVSDVNVYVYVYVYGKMFNERINIGKEMMRPCHDGISIEMDKEGGKERTCLDGTTVVPPNIHATRDIEARGGRGGGGRTTIETIREHSRTSENIRWVSI